MSCEGNEKCPIHGTRHMKRLHLDSGVTDSYCAGCHAGEMAARAEYERGVVRGAKQMMKGGR